MKNSEFEARYPYSGDMMETDEMGASAAMFQTYPPQPQPGMRLVQNYEPVETHIPRPSLQYPQQHPTAPPSYPGPSPRPLQKPQVIARPPPFPSRLRPPANYYHSSSSQQHSSSLPPIHLHPTTTTTVNNPVASDSGDVRGREHGVTTKLPIIHGRSNAYASRTNRTG